MDDVPDKEVEDEVDDNVHDDIDTHGIEDNNNKKDNIDGDYDDDIQGDDSGVKKDKKSSKYEDNMSMHEENFEEKSGLIHDDCHTGISDHLNQVIDDFGFGYTFSQYYAMFIKLHLNLLQVLCSMSRLKQLKMQPSAACIILSYEFNLIQLSTITYRKQLYCYIHKGCIVS